jgi:hypothetical protein
MGFNFPASPALGATYTSGGVTYTWNGYGWVGGGIGDAPADGKTYGRKDTSWSEAATKADADTKVAKTGDTMSGDLWIGKAWPTLHLNKPDATTLSQIAIKTAGKDRWTVGGGSSPDDFYINRCDDAGTYIDAPLSIQRSTGKTIVGSDPTAALGVATKQYVDNKVAAVPAPDLSSKVSKSGDTMSGGLTLNSGLSTNAAVQFNQQPASVYQAGPGGLLIYANGAAGYDAFLSYWRPGGGYATNMGLMNDNRFGFGGWSVGYGVQYRFWSREDFSEPPVHNTRLVYVGDVTHTINSGLQEPYGRGACVTGLSGFDNYGAFGYTARYAQNQVRRSDGYYNCEGA